MAALGCRGPPGTVPPQASRLDVCCCLRAQELPAPSQREGPLLRFFRKVYAPVLLHRVTRVVVVSGAGGQLVLTRAGRGLLSPTLTWRSLGSLAVERSLRSGCGCGSPGWGAAGTQGQLGASESSQPDRVGRAAACAQ